jgi:hypothetical protein
MFSAKINLYKPFSRLVKKNQLLTLDVIYQGKPFVNVVSSNQNNYNLDTIYNGQPFVGTPNNYIRRSLIGTNHPDVEMWLNTITLNGGSASNTTISALNTFCNSIDSAGLRNKFYRLNLFCGNNLNSCLVPLYVSRTWNETAYGFYIDQNTNFTNNDYNETGLSGGLVGNGSNKRLDTGIKLSDIPSLSDMHLSTWKKSEILSALGTYIGVRSDASSTSRYRITKNVDIGGSITGTIGKNNNVNATGTTYDSTGLALISRTSQTSLVMYWNGTSINTNNTDTSPDSSIMTFYIFCDNINGVFQNYLGGTMCSYSIGTGMTDTQATNYNTIIQTFQTALNRNI